MIARTPNVNIRSEQIYLLWDALAVVAARNEIEDRREIYRSLREHESMVFSFVEKGNGANLLTQKNGLSTSNSAMAIQSRILYFKYCNKIEKHKFWKTITRWNKMSRNLECEESLLKQKYEFLRQFSNAL